MHFALSMSGQLPKLLSDCLASGGDVCGWLRLPFAKSGFLMRRPYLKQRRSFGAVQPSLLPYVLLLMLRVFASCSKIRQCRLDAILVDERDLVYAKLTQALHLTNGLSISPSAYVTDPEFKHIGDRIAAKGVRVEYLDLTVSGMFGGAFWCSALARIGDAIPLKIRALGQAPNGDPAAL